MNIDFKKTLELFRKEIVITVYIKRLEINKDHFEALKHEGCSSELNTENYHKGYMNYALYELYPSDKLPKNILRIYYVVDDSVPELELELKRLDIEPICLSPSCELDQALQELDDLGGGIGGI